MYDLWNTELTSAEESALLEKAAQEIRKRKLETAAVLALEMHKPLANVAMHGVVAFSGFLIPFLGFENVNDYSRLLRKPENIERLICLLETSPKGESAPASNTDAAVRRI
jgi:acyl-CoA reductase-like NAD-dependent aldehyde dehydrogenase